MRAHFTLLGTVTGKAEGEVLVLGGAKQKTVLAMMLLGGGRSVSRDSLLHAVWGDDPPDGAPGTLQVFMSNLRRVVCADQPNGIRFDGHGYAIAFAYDLDVFEFEELCRRAQAARPGDAVRIWRQALAIFRGDPLGGLEPTEPVRREQVRLAEARLTALDALYAAALDSGRHREVLAELLTVADEHPLREQLRRALMIALYRSGRQVEALRTYQAFRERMIEELGIEPSPDLRRLEQLILDQSPQLDESAIPVSRAASTIDVRTASTTEARLELEDGRTIGLTRRVTSIGRDETADVAIADLRVSRQHAVIRARAGRFEIVDDGSTNGTSVNGLGVERDELTHGDVILLGGFEMRFLQ